MSLLQRLWYPPRYSKQVSLEKSEAQQAVREATLRLEHTQSQWPEILERVGTLRNIRTNWRI